MIVNRRSFIAAGAALAISANRAKAQTRQYTRRTLVRAEYTPVLDMLGRAPYSPSAAGDARQGVTYMFANKSCAICHAFLRRYAGRFTDTQLRNIAIQWPNDPPDEMSYVLEARNEATFMSYMNRTLRVPTGYRRNGLLASQAIAVKRETVKFFNAPSDRRDFATPVFLSAVFDADGSVRHCLLIGGWDTEWFDLLT